MAILMTSSNGNIFRVTGPLWGGGWGWAGCGVWWGVWGVWGVWGGGVWGVGGVGCGGVEGWGGGEIHQSPVNSPHKEQWRGALKFYLICPWTKGWVNNHDAGDLRHHRPHHGVIVMKTKHLISAKVNKYMPFRLTCMINYLVNLLVY